MRVQVVDFFTLDNILIEISQRFNTSFDGLEVHLQ